VLRPRIVDLGQVLRETQAMLQRLIGEDVDLSTSICQAPACVSADRSQLEQVLLNLVVNARDAMPDGGKVTVEVDVVTVDAAYAKEHLGIAPGRFVMMAVSDTGVGMDAVTKARIFEPFFSTKAAGHGTGLGLATVFGIVKQSGGNIWVYSEPGSGSTFKVYLPHTEEQPSESPSATSGGPLNTRRATVLVVEDEAQLRSLIVTVLRADGHEVLEAADPRTALEMSEAHVGHIDLLLTDVVMPQISGKQLADKLLRARPGLRVVYMSGYTENTIVHRGVLEAGVHFIPKPVVPNALREMLSNVLSDRREGASV
jgi:CheY-like chemotaxis protein